MERLKIFFFFNGTYTYIYILKITNVVEFIQIIESSYKEMLKCSWFCFTIRIWQEAEHLLKCYGAEAPKVSGAAQAKNPSGTHRSCKKERRVQRDFLKENAKPLSLNVTYKMMIEKITPLMVLRIPCLPARVWGPMGFFKFPTTPHVLDLTNGKALTESDRLLSEKEAQEFFDAWQGKMSVGYWGVTMSHYLEGGRHG